MSSVVIHGHFYQPPREDPFLDEVESEPSAAPFHDWNQRIERECYRAIVAARVAGSDGRIARLVNTLESISFNFGPTLLEWMEREAKPTYEAILAADQESAARLGGHGNAIAQPYHHTILPLATRRDKRTEVRWGIADFRRRFGREPEGMWLPETAVDLETLEVLAEEGHSVHDPGAAPGVEGSDGRSTRAVSPVERQVDRVMHLPRRFLARGRVRRGVARRRGVGARPHGRREVARTGHGDSARAAPRDPRRLPRRRLRPCETRWCPSPPTARHTVITTSSARWRWPLRSTQCARAACASRTSARSSRAIRAVDDVELVAPTSWSCAHGVGRWKENCGCRIDGNRYPSQAWRTPLREGLNALATTLHEVYEREAIRLMPDPWGARDAYGTVVASDAIELERFTSSVATLATTDEDRVRARELLELERDALRMFTSCGWFFDDIAGIEPRQDLRYAARAIALAGSSAAPAESALLDTLAQAVSNDRSAGTGRDIYLRSARPAFPAPMRQAAAAVAARHVSSGERKRFTSATVEIDDDWVRVSERRTGRTARLPLARHVADRDGHLRGVDRRPTAPCMCCDWPTCRSARASRFARCFAG